MRNIKIYSNKIYSKGTGNNKYILNKNKNVNIYFFKFLYILLPYSIFSFSFLVINTKKYILKHRFNKILSQHPMTFY